MLRGLLMFAAVIMAAVAQPIWTVDHHPIPAGKSGAGCKDADHVSYHIHVMIWQNNAVQTAKTMDFQRRFMEHFDLLDKENCTFGAGDTAPEQKTICTFEVDWEPAGPFFTAQYSWFIPKADYERATAWTKQNRDDLDVLIHPNSGCMVEDHTDWAIWAGKPWQIDPSIFTCRYPGCRLP